MSYLAGMSTGRRPCGMRAVLYGVEKMGKTTLASQAPGALIIPTESGTESADARAARGSLITTWAEFCQVLNELVTAGQQGHLQGKTVVFDSVTAIERLIHDSIVGVEPSVPGKKAVTMESALGGYGAAYTHANKLFSDMLRTCDYLALYCACNIIFTAHAFASKTVDPTAGEYDQWDILLHSPKNNKTYGKRELITQWADLIGFLYEQVFISKGENVSIATTSSTGGRQLAVQRKASYVAGNRYGMVSDISVPKDQGWNYVAKAIYDATSGVVDVFTR